MISSNGHAKLSEKGLLTPDNCVVALIDHQPQMLFGVSSADRQTIINNTVALAKAARVFDVRLYWRRWKRADENAVCFHVAHLHILVSPISEQATAPRK